MISLPLTLDDTVGPYFPGPFVPNSGLLDLYRPHQGLHVGPKGEPVVLRVRLLDIDGLPAGSSVLEVWHASTAGHLRVPGAEKALADDPFFEGYARAYSPSGEFVIRTSMPGSLKEGAVKRSPFVTLTIFSDGISRIVTQIFFEGTEDMASDPVLSGLPSGLADRLIARRHGDSVEGTIYAIDIKMRGEDETPFFDDQVSERRS